MNFKKKKYFCLLVISLILSNIIEGSESDDDIDNIGEIGDIEIIREPTTNSSALSKLLLAHIQYILKNDLFIKTNTVLKRPTQTLPIFNLYHTDHICQDWLIRLSLFGNKTDRAFFGNNEFIRSYLDVNLNDLENISKFVGNIIDIPTAVEMFRITKKQERRAGLMIQVLKNFFDDFSFEFTIPLLYEERNYFFTQKEREDIEALFKNKPEKEQEKILQKHALSDKFGFGDARMKLGYLVFNKNNIAIKFGIQTTLPISFAFKRGLLGSNFTKVTEERQSINLKEIIEMKDNEDDPKYIKKAGQTTLKEKGEKFGLKTADWLSAMVLDSPLGNNRHFSLGVFLEPQIKLNNAVVLKAISYIEYFFSANEKRFFLKQKNPKDFDTDRLSKIAKSMDQIASGDALDFLGNQASETFSPLIYCAQVTPGFMFQLSVGPQFRLREWDFLIGYDFWYQQKEKINFVFDAPSNLKINKATKPKAFQSKIFLKLAYNKIEPNRDWSIALSLEDSLATKRIGKDFAVAASFEINY